MKAEEKENLYGLLRDSGDVLGTSRATMVALGAMIDVVKSSQPKIVPLLQLIREFERESKAYLNADLQDRRKQAVEILERKLKSYRASIKRVIETGTPLVQDGEMIVVHMASYMVTNLLIRAKQALKRKFKVIILQQLVVRSKQAINALTDVGIEHIIAPAHDLGHYLESSNKLFAAAATITKDRKVMAAEHRQLLQSERDSRLSPGSFLSFLQRHL